MAMTLLVGGTIVVATLMVLLVVILYSIKKLTVPTITFYEGVKGAHAPLLTSAHFCLDKARASSKIAQDRMQGMHLSVRLFYFFLFAVILVCDLSLAIETLPVILGFRFEWPLPPLPVLWFRMVWPSLPPLGLASVLGFFCTLAALKLVITERQGALSDPGEHLHSPTLAKEGLFIPRMCIGALFGIVLAAAFFRTRILEGQSIAHANELVALALAAVMFAALWMLGSVLLKMVAAIAATWHTLISVLWGMGFVLTRILAGTCAFAMRLIERFNPGVAQTDLARVPLVTPGKPIVKVIRGGNAALIPLPPPTAPKEVLVFDYRFCDLVDVGATTYDLMVYTALSGQPLVHSCAIVENEAMVRAAPHTRAKNVSPTPEQLALILEEVARAPNNKRQIMMREQLKAAEENMRLERAKAIRPTTVQMTFGPIQVLSDQAVTLKTFKTECPYEMHHLGVSLAAPTDASAAYKEASALQQQALLDAALLYSKDSPAATYWGGGEKLHEVMGRGLASFVRASSYTEAQNQSLADMLDEMPKTATVWGFAADSAVVPSIKAQKWVSFGRADVPHVIQQVETLLESITNDVSSHAWPSPIDPSLRSFWVFLLPFKSGERTFRNVVSQLRRDLPLDCSFIPLNGFPKRGMEGKFVCTAFCLFPIVLPPNALPAPDP